MSFLSASTLTIRNQHYIFYSSQSKEWILKEKLILTSANKDIFISELKCVERSVFLCFQRAWLRGCLKRVVPGIIRRQGAAKILNFVVIILLHRYSLRLSLAFQTTSKPMFFQSTRSPLLSVLRPSSLPHGVLSPKVFQKSSWIAIVLEYLVRLCCMSGLIADWRSCYTGFSQ